MAAGPTTRSSGAQEAIIPVSGTALLLIDVINDLAFEGSDALVAQAEPMATRLAALKRRSAAAGIPNIYINDNFGQWRSDFRTTVAQCTSRRSPGRRVSQRLKPTARDYCWEAATASYARACGVGNSSRQQSKSCANTSKRAFQPFRRSTLSSRGRDSSRRHQTL